MHSVYISVFTVSFYLSLDHEKFIKSILEEISSKKIRKKTRKFIQDVENKLGRWLMGQATLATIVGILTFIHLSILKVPFALPLALFAALMDSVPYIGATLGATPAILIALLGGNPIQIIGVIAAYILVQQLENNFLSPKILSNAMGLPPLIIVLSLLIGAKLFGLAGVLFAVPVAGVLSLTFRYLKSLND